MRGVVLAVCCIGLLALWVDRADAFEPQLRPTLEISRADGPIRIDGDLTDAGWRDAVIADGFAETDPGDQTEPAVDSKAMVTYDSSNLYVALIAYDNPEEVRVSLRDRDSIFRDDYFGIMLETYGDLGWGYEFFVNALGIQGDLRMTSDGNEDIGFDVVWHSEGKVTENGYQVEIAIPFSSLRFPDKPEQEWRINFWRDRQRDTRYRYTWAAQDRDDPCFMCQWGHLRGLSGLERSSSLDVIASLQGFQSGARIQPDEPKNADPKFENDDPDGDASLNLRYAITSNSSVEATINPDFSQIESDAGQIDVNETFALFFPERRPFFQEGSNLYNTWVDAIYTRSINDPDLAGKLTGKFGKTSLLWLIAREDESEILVPLSERSKFLAIDKSTSNIFRIRHSVLEDSYVGGLATNRRHDGGGSGTTFGVDNLLRFQTNYRWENQVVGSYTQEPDSPFGSAAFDSTRFDGDSHTVGFDGEDYLGHAIYSSLERSGRHYNADFDYWEHSPTFRTENGFTTGNDRRRTTFWNGYWFNNEGEFLLDWEPSVSIGRIWTYGNKFKEDWIGAEVDFSFTKATELEIGGSVGREEFAGERFDEIRDVYVGADSRFSEAFSVGAFTRYGRRIFRSRNDPRLGDQFDLEVEADIKPSQQVQIGIDWAYAEMESAREGQGLLFSGYILRSRVDVNFTRKFFARAVVEYSSFDDEVAVEPLLTYRVNPFTVFFLGANSRLLESPTERGKLTPEETEWHQESRQFFLKLQYLVQL